MKRFLIFLLVGPFLGVTLVSAALNSNLSWWLYFAVMLGIDTKTYIVLMPLLTWLSDVILVHWEVQRRIRMIVLGGGVTILTVGLERYSTGMLAAGLICGAVAAFCVWLSDRAFPKLRWFWEQIPRRIAFMLITPVIATFAVVEYLNFSGFCYPQRRYLSSDELIASAIRDSLKRHSPDPNSTRRKMYASLEDFHRQNRDCCILFQWNTGPFGNSVLLRILGHYEALVDIVYRINDGAGEESFYGSMTLIGSCGAIYEVRGFPMARSIKPAA